MRQLRALNLSHNKMTRQPVTPFIFPFIPLPFTNKLLTFLTNLVFNSLFCYYYYYKLGLFLALSSFSSTSSTIYLPIQPVPDTLILTDSIHGEILLYTDQATGHILSGKKGSSFFCGPSQCRAMRLPPNSSSNEWFGGCSGERLRARVRWLFSATAWPHPSSYPSSPFLRPWQPQRHRSDSTQKRALILVDKWLVQK